MDVVMTRINLATTTSNSGGGGRGGGLGGVVATLQALWDSEGMAGLLRGAKPRLAHKVGENEEGVLR
jgi:hypothetical protein